MRTLFVSACILSVWGAYCFGLDAAQKQAIDRQIQQLQSAPKPTDDGHLQSHLESVNKELDVLMSKVSRHLENVKVHQQKGLAALDNFAKLYQRSPYKSRRWLNKERKQLIRLCCTDDGD